MAGFISMVYAVLKVHNIDTSGMSVQEAIKKFDELEGKREREGNQSGEAKRVFEQADSLGVDYDRDTNYQAVKAKVDEAQKDDNVVELSDDNELARLISSSDDKKNKVIKDYLIKYFAGRTFELSDGLVATVSNKDVDKLSNKVDDKRIAQLADFNNIIKKAKFSHITDDVNHEKFSKFRYYKCKVRFRGNENEIWLNIGYHRQLKDWHIYAITTIK